MEKRDGEVDREEGDQKRLRAGIERVGVVAVDPQAAQPERRQEARHVDHPPRTVPRQHQHADVEDGIVAEQRQRAALGTGSKDGSREPSDQGQQGQRLRPLQQSEQRA